MVNKKIKTSIIIVLIAAVFMLLIKPVGTKEVFKWQIMCFFVSFLFRPALLNKNLKLVDGGFVFSLSFGSLISFLPLCFLSGFGLIPFNTISCLTSFLFFATLVNVFSTKNYIKFNWNKEKFSDFLFGFALFTFIFVVCCYFKEFRPYITNQTEEYMNLGILNKLYRQETFPIMDFWFSGENLNYYYLGHAVLVYLIKISFTTPNIIYNLAQCTLTSFIFISVFTLTAAIITFLLKEKKTISIVIGGISGAIMATFAGNGDWLINGVFKRLITKENYWFVRAVGSLSKADGTDNLLHETTAYALVIGDLHAHLIVVFFTLPLIAILLDYAASNTTTKQINKTLYQELFSPYIISISLFLGIISGANYWDFPIFYVISGTIILFTDLCNSNNKLKTIIIVLLKGMIIYVFSYTIILPFNLQFDKNYGSLLLTDRHTEISSLLNLWGVRIFAGLFVIFWIFKRPIKEQRKINPFEISVIGLVVCLFGLILMPEIIYLKDIYGPDYQRYNTMFKLTFEAFILLGMLVGVSVGLLISKTSKLNIIATSVCVVIVCLSGAYIFECVYDWFGNNNYHTLSTEQFFDKKDTINKQKGAVDYLNKDLDKNLVVLQKAGDSYKENNWLSVFTGSSTIVGWSAHEWIWRNDWPSVAERMGETKMFYESGNQELCKEIINKYDIDYIYVGDEELESYSIDYSGFLNFVDTVWISDDDNYFLYKVFKD